jgi:N-acetylmuramoyl-L-alanine amidase
MSFTPDFAPARVRLSPNVNERKDGIAPDAIILHYTGMKTAEGAEDWLCDTRSQVSSHYLVYEDGSVVQMVPEGKRAWHAGVSYWQGETDLNSHSVGIEIANPGHDLGYVDFPDAQIEAVIHLCRDIMARWNISPRRVLAHSDIAPTRKIDPGEKFPWSTLAREGVAHYLPPAPLREGTSLTRGDAGEDVKKFNEDLRRFGYLLSSTDIYNDDTATVVKAFQRHYRPVLVDGIADYSTIVTLARYLQSYDL